MARIHGYLAPHRTGVMFVCLLIVSFLLLAFSSGRVVLKPKEIGLSIFSVFEGGFTGLGSFLSRTVNSVGELKRLRVQYAQLENQISDLETVERDVAELRAENQLLREQLGFAQTLSYTHIAAEVIGKDPGNLFSTIVINKGSRQGIAKDMSVVAYQDGFQGLVGKILVVSANSSIVLPITDPNCYVAGRLQSSRFDGLVSGAGSGAGDLNMSFVQKRARDLIQYGDLVITSGMNSIYPKGIYIGRVRDIAAKAWETSLELKIEPVIDFSRLEYVFVVKKPADEQDQSAGGESSSGPATPPVGAGD